MNKELNKTAIYSSDDMLSFADYMKDQCIQIAYNRLKYNSKEPFPNVEDAFEDWYMGVKLPELEQILKKNY